MPHLGISLRNVLGGTVATAGVHANDMLLIVEALASTLFWVGVIQWALIGPVAGSFSLVLFSKTEGVGGALARALVLLFITAAILTIPLIFFQAIPLPLGKERSFYMLGAILGGLVSIPLTMSARARLARRGLI